MSTIYAAEMSIEPFNTSATTPQTFISQQMMNAAA